MRATATGGILRLPISDCEPHAQTALRPVRTISAVPAHAEGGRTTSSTAASTRIEGLRQHRLSGERRRRPRRTTNDLYALDRKLADVILPTEFSISVPISVSISFSGGDFRLPDRRRAADRATLRALDGGRSPPRVPQEVGEWAAGVSRRRARLQAPQPALAQAEPAAHILRPEHGHGRESKLRAVNLKKGLRYVEDWADAVSSLWGAPSHAGQQGGRRGIRTRTSRRARGARRSSCRLGRIRRFTSRRPCRTRGVCLG